MATAEQKKRMVEFITGGLEDSGLYNMIQSGNSHILVAERPDQKERPMTIDVLAHNYHRTMSEFRGTIKSNESHGIGTAHIFYKDGEIFMVRLGSRGNIKDEKSLKRYSKNQIDAMIHLRYLEKAVLRMSGGVLAYFQPKTERLGEGIRTFKMGRVELDYTHIRPGDPGYGFARDTVSRDYGQAVQIGATITGPIGLLVSANGYKSIAPITSKENSEPVKPKQPRLF